MKTTLDDAIAAHEKQHPTCADAFRLADWLIVRRFLQSLKSMAEPLVIPTDAEGFIIEGAMQHGFEPIDDDIALYAVSGSKLIDFVKLQRTPRPIDMILHCPSCGRQHIDEPGDMTRWANLDHPASTSEPWTNPPHRSHLCHACGYVWRPADVPTNGVKAITTKGGDDDDLPPIKS